MTLLDHVTGLVCMICGSSYPAPEAGYVCPDHGNEGILDVRYDYEQVGSRMTKESLAADPDPTMWRYRSVMPVAPDAAVPPLTVGGTPLYEAQRLAEPTGVARVWVKDEGRQPTASLKDRASAMAIVKAREKGAQVVTTASTGNAAAALAGLSASVGLANVIFVPESAPEAKIAQLLAYGSKVALVAGTYGDAFELCMEASVEYGWYNRNTGFNPYMTEGKKTVMLEVLEQLQWNVPDAVFVSVGDGSIIGGVHKGIKDALALGWISEAPRIFGVQSAGSDYLVQAFEGDEDVLTKPPISANTVADSISADLPRDRLKAMAAVKETGGAYLRVSDDEILDAIPTWLAVLVSLPSRRRPPPTPGSSPLGIRVSSAPRIVWWSSPRAVASRMSPLSCAASQVSEPSRCVCSRISTHSSKLFPRRPHDRPDRSRGNAAIGCPTGTRAVDSHSNLQADAQPRPDSR